MADRVLMRGGVELRVSCALKHALASWGGFDACSRNVMRWRWLTTPHAARRSQEDAAARADALRALQQQLLGRKQGEALKAQLQAAMDKERHSKQLENSAASNDVCQRLEMACTRQLDALGRMAVPSMRQFEGSFGKCKAQFEVGGRGGAGKELWSTWGRPLPAACRVSMLPDAPNAVWRYASWRIEAPLSCPPRRPSASAPRSPPAPSASTWRGRAHTASLAPTTTGAC